MQPDDRVRHARHLRLRSSDESPQSRSLRQRRLSYTLRVAAQPKHAVYRLTARLLTYQLPRGFGIGQVGKIGLRPVRDSAAQFLHPFGMPYSKDAPAQLYRLLKAAPVSMRERHPLPVRGCAAGGVDRVPADLGQRSQRTPRRRVGVV